MRIPKDCKIFILNHLAGLFGVKLKIPLSATYRDSFRTQVKQVGPPSFLGPHSSPPAVPSVLFVPLPSPSPAYVIDV